MGPLIEHTNRPSQSDEELALRMQAGSSDALNDLIDRLGQSLYGFLLLRVGNAEDARELAQDTWIRAWTKISHYRPAYKFSTWLFTLARRLAASHGRRQRSHAGGDFAFDEMRIDQDPAEPMVVAERRGALWTLARRVLSSDQRSALWLRYGEDLPIEEIAAILGKTRPGIRLILFRARERLREHLQEEFAAEMGSAAKGRRGAQRRKRAEPPARGLGGDAPSAVSWQSGGADR